MADLYTSLALYKFMLQCFGIENLKELRAELEKTRPPLDVEGQSPYLMPYLEAYQNISLPISIDKFHEYDQNIVSHLKTINIRRGVNERIRLTYFQYFTALFTEYYLDRFSGDKERFCKDLNEFLKSFNYKYRLAVKKFLPDEMNKLAVWNVTGSGKTLIMHINMLQTKHYLNKSQKSAFLLLTPNEGLTEQHLTEFFASGINAKRFEKSTGLFSNEITVIEITKLTDQKEGPETVHIDSFGNDNTLFVDEGHTGATGNRWMPYRKNRCRDGFSFEYSATFGQAVSGRGNEELQDE